MNERKQEEKMNYSQYDWEYGAEEREYDKQLLKGLSSLDMDFFREAMANDDVEKIVMALCGSEATNDFRTNIVMAAFNANSLAHYNDGLVPGDPGYEEDGYGFYDVKSYLLEYIFEHDVWGESPYESFGIGWDDHGSDVAYFDVPNCGQVSFHLVYTYVGPDAPNYPYKWCGVCNGRFPSYSKIDSLHNLLMALDYRSADLRTDEEREQASQYEYEYEGEYEHHERELYKGVNTTKALHPIDFSKIRDDEEIHTCYFVDDNDIWDKIHDEEDEYSDDEDYSEDEDFVDYDYDAPIDISKVDRIPVRKIVFNKKDGILDTSLVSDRNQKIALLKEFQSDYYDFDDVMKRMGIMKKTKDTDDPEI